MKKFRITMVLMLSLWGVRIDASCCASGSTGGIARLLPHERALVELSQDAHRVVGRFGDQAYFDGALPESLPAWQFNHELQIMTRLAPFFLPYVKLPVRTQVSSVRAGSGIADMTLGARWPILNEHFIEHWPAITLFSSLQLPTGASLESNSSAPIEDITGLGVMLLSFGTAAERSWAGILWTMAYHISFEPRLFQKTGFAGGPLHVPSCNMGFLLHDTGTLSAGLSAAFATPAEYDGKRIYNSSRRKISATIAYAWKFHSHLGINFSLGGDVPISSLGKNNNSELFARVGMRVGVF